MVILNLLESRISSHERKISIANACILYNLKALEILINSKNQNKGKRETIKSLKQQNYTYKSHIDDAVKKIDRLVKRANENKWYK